jgi:hypothetical protein
MNEQEVRSTSYGMMCDLISCFSIYNGNAEQKQRKKTYDEIMRMD